MSHFFAPHCCWLCNLNTLYLRKIPERRVTTSGESWFDTVHLILRSIHIWIHVSGTRCSLVVSCRYCPPDYLLDPMLLYLSVPMGAAVSYMAWLMATKRAFGTVSNSMILKIAQANMWSFIFFSPKQCLLSLGYCAPKTSVLFVWKLQKSLAKQKMNSTSCCCVARAIKMTIKSFVWVVPWLIFIPGFI